GGAVDRAHSGGRDRTSQPRRRRVGTALRRCAGSVRLARAGAWPDRRAGARGASRGGCLRSVRAGRTGQPHGVAGPICHDHAAVGDARPRGPARAASPRARLRAAGRRLLSRAAVATLSGGVALGARGRDHVAWRGMSTGETRTRGGADALRLVSARSLELGELVRVFNLGFSDYLVPMVMDEAALSEHIACNDIDLGCPRVAVDVEPVGLALAARRGHEAWIGGMGTAPAYRRIGLG